MRWFKHFCDTQNSESLDAIIERFGFSGYGRWFRILEAIGSKMDSSDRCHLELSVRRWCEILRLRPAQLREFCEATQQIMNKNCADDAKVVLNVCSDIAYFRVPNLLKIRDEYTSRIGSESGETTPQIKKEKKSKDKEEEKNPPLPPKRGERNPSVDFDEIKNKWNQAAAEAGLIQARVIGDKIKRRYRTAANCSGFDFDALLEQIETYPPQFTDQTGKQWRADLDYCLREWESIMNGKWADKYQKQGKANGQIRKTPRPKPMPDGTTVGTLSQCKNWYWADDGWHER